MSGTQPFQFSLYGQQSIEPSPVNVMMSEFAKDFRPGIDINLGVGYVNEDTIPYEEVASVINILMRNEKRPPHLLNYGGPEGSERLINAIKEFYKELHTSGRIGEIPDFNERKLIIGVSGATSILTGLANVFAPGLVIMTDPLYYIYSSTLERYGFEVLPIAEDQEGPSVNILERTLESNLKQGRRISFCYFVTVNNPTCTIMSNTRRRQLIECVCSLSNNFGIRIPIIFDLAYEWLIHNPSVEKPVSPSFYDVEDIVYEIGTLSKVFAPALRIGFIIGPKNSALLKALVQWNSDVGFSAPLITQEISVELLKNIGITQFDRVNMGYREKGSTLKSYILEKIGDYIEEIKGGDAGFYLYLTFNNIFTGKNSNFFKRLTRQTGDITWDFDSTGNIKRPRVIYIPGVYCVHPHGIYKDKGQFQMRISYGYESKDNLLRSVDIMKETLSYSDKQ